MNTMAGCPIRHKPANAGRTNIMSNKLLKQKFKKYNKIKKNEIEK